MAIGPKLRNELIGGVCLLFFIIAIFFAGKQMKEENKLKKEFRVKRDLYEKVLDGTYRCVQPQILDSLVVIPITVRRRDAPADRVLSLSDEILTVELSVGSTKGVWEGAHRDLKKREGLYSKTEESNDRLKVLICDAVNGRPQDKNIDDRPFAVKVFSGSAGGPTGLAVGVSRPGFGSRLAVVVGRALEGAAVGGGIAPPPVRVGISGGRGGKTE